MIENYPEYCELLKRLQHKAHFEPLINDADQELAEKLYWLLKQPNISDEIKKIFLYMGNK